MSAAGTDSSKGTWAVAAGAALAAAALAAILFRAPAAPAPPPARLKPAIELPLPGNLRANDQADFKDPTPLFLPTQWNSSPPEAGHREPEGSFTGYESKYVFSDNDLHLNLPRPVAVPGSPAKALVATAPGNPLLGIGRADGPSPVVSRRWAFVEIVAAATGRRIFSRTLEAAADLRDAPPLLGTGNWQPLEFMAAVDASGLVGQLTPVVGPGEGGEDPFLQLQDVSLAAVENYLALKLRIGDRLPPGFYRIWVGP